MGAGYDFTENEDEVLQEQRDAARAAEDWQNMTEKTLAGELNGLNSRVSSCIKQLKRMLDDNDYKKTKDKLDALVQKDLSSEGFIESFINTNAGFFDNYTSGDARPEWLKSFSAEEHKTYETVLKYYKDAKWLLNVTAAMQKMLQMLPLEEGFRLMRIKGNFEEAGFDLALYKQIDEEFRSVSVLLNRSWDEHELCARKARMYIEKNLTEVRGSAFEKGYRQARIEDFQQMISRSSIGQSLVAQSDGHFKVSSYMLLLADIIDKYTYKVGDTPDLKDPMQKVIAECSRLINGGDIANAEKNCTTQPAQFLCAAFRTLCEAVIDLAQSALKTYENFKAGKEESPYCFMRKLSSIGSAVRKYEFNPRTNDPWESGTFYKEMYTEAAAAISTLCRLFVYDHGTTLVY